MILFPNLITRKILLANFFHLIPLNHVMLCESFVCAWKLHLMVNEKRQHREEILNYKPLNIYTHELVYYALQP